MALFILDTNAAFEGDDRLRIDRGANSRSIEITINEYYLKVFDRTIGKSCKKMREKGEVMPKKEERLLPSKKRAERPIEEDKIMAHMYNMNYKRRVAATIFRGLRYMYESEGLVEKLKSYELNVADSEYFVRRLGNFSAAEARTFLSVCLQIPEALCPTSTIWNEMHKYRVRRRKRNEDYPGDLTDDMYCQEGKKRRTAACVCGDASLIESLMELIPGYNIVRARNLIDEAARSEENRAAAA